MRSICIGGVEAVFIIHGENLYEHFFTVRDEQVRIEGNVKLQLFRNDDRRMFEIQLVMPWGNIYTIEAYWTEEEATERFTFLRQGLAREAKIVLGSKMSIVPAP